MQCSELNDYNNGSSSSEPQIITNLETVLISSIPHFADLSEQRNNTDLPEQLVTGEHIVPKSLHPLIQLEKYAVTTSFLRFISKKNVRQFQTAISIFHWVLRSLSENIETGKYFFVKLGHEECEDCEYSLLHNEDHKKDNLAPDCAICQQWDEHIKKADESRTRYKEYAEREPVEGEIVFSVDLEKVIMLPRCDMFENVIFSQRIIAYNESFVPVGTKQMGGIKPVVAIWHDVIAGRTKENVISTFYCFFLHHRDEKKTILWLDNCTAQNKNSAFFSFLIFNVNCEAVATERIEINYFEPGYTYMSADSFHHQVEMSLKRYGKVYDFVDFKNAVQNANSSRVVLEMTLEFFFEWQDLSSI
ncbi:hypothetical protein JTB14_009058 [Gonioctena quinquepunctata]|nr:hypothetical protein JTB14_009058 [Gonioctena quinquepunctata]